MTDGLILNYSRILCIFTLEERICKREIMWIVCTIHFLWQGMSIKTWRCTTISDLMINEQIRDREVRLIGQDGEQLGIMSAREAQKIALEAELDLVKIAPTAKPPVCKIIDYGKYKYEQTRKEKEAKKSRRL